MRFRHSSEYLSDTVVPVAGHACQGQADRGVDAGHIVPRNEVIKMIKETLDCLDRYLGFVT
jgi:hypothetical protein